MSKPSVIDADAFLDYAWERGWLDERFGDDPAHDPDPQELLDNLLLGGLAEVSGVTIIDEDGSPVPGTQAAP